MKKVISLLLAVAVLVVLCVVIAKFGYAETEVESDGSEVGSVPSVTSAGASDESSDFIPKLIVTNKEVSWKTKQCFDEGDNYGDYLAYFTVQLDPGATYKLNLDMSYLTIDDEGYGGEKLGFDISGIYCWEGESEYIYSEIKRDLHHTSGKLYFSTPEGAGTVTVNIYMLYAYEETGFEDYPPQNENISFDLYRVK